MAARRLFVFFYGLFMDAELLRTKGVAPENIQPGSVHDMALRIGNRATLVTSPGARAFGIVMELTHDAIDRLYAEPSVSAYRPEAVIVELPSGSTVAALCFNLVDPPSPDEVNPDYAAKLRDLARRLKLPADYVDSI